MAMRRIMNVAPDKASRLLLGLLPVGLVILIYVLMSNERLMLNPDDKLMPSLSSMGSAVARYAFTADQRTGDVLLWVDTASSLVRLFQGLLISTVSALVIGLLIGVIPLIRAGFAPLVAIISVVPPMAILPILFIIFGLGELSKVALIVIGLAPFLVRDLSAYSQAIPVEQFIKAQTLGASTWQYIIRVALPQTLPRLIESTRLSLGPAWLFLISAEAIAAESGLGYRIFLVRRYLAMDVIIPYVIWITLIAFLSDLLLAAISRKLFPWAHAEEPGQ
jgi:NitT/TauT family transport system permease protein